MLKLFFTDFELFKTIYTGSCHPMIYRINGQKYYKNARNILINTFPKLNEYMNSSILYLCIFPLLHFIYILFCIIVFMTIFYIIHKMIKLKYKNLDFKKIYPYFIILSILIIIYIYTFTNSSI